MTDPQWRLIFTPDEDLVIERRGSGHALESVDFDHLLKDLLDRAPSLKGELYQWFLGAADWVTTGCYVADEAERSDRRCDADASA